MLRKHSLWQPVSIGYFQKGTRPERQPVSGVQQNNVTRVRAILGWIPQKVRQEVKSRRPICKQVGSSYKAEARGQPSGDRIPDQETDQE